MRYLTTLFLSLVLIVSVPASFASTGAMVVDGSFEPAGFTQIADASAVVGLGTIPAAARMALIQAVDQNIRWRDDGTDPDASTGMVLEAGQTLVYIGRLSSFRLIEAAAGAEVNVSFYR